ASRKTGLVSTVSARASNIAIRSFLSGFATTEARAPGHGSKLALCGHHVYRDQSGRRCSVAGDCAAEHPLSADRARRVCPVSMVKPNVKSGWVGDVTLTFTIRMEGKTLG